MIYDNDLKPLCSDSEFEQYEQYIWGKENPLRLKVWLGLHRGGFI